MAEIDLAELGRVADAATQGEWDYGLASLGNKIGADHDQDGWTIIAECPCPRSPWMSARAEQWRADAKHIATFDPPMVKALLVRIDAAEAERENWKSRAAERDAEAERRARLQWSAEAALASERERREALERALEPFAKMAPRYFSRELPVLRWVSPSGEEIYITPEDFACAFACLNRALISQVWGSTLSPPTLTDNKECSS